MLLLVPICSLLLTAALATMTAGALLAPSCALHARYEVSCQEVRQAILNSSAYPALSGTSFQVVSHNTRHVKLTHVSSRSGAEYSFYFALDSSEPGKCACEAITSSSRWFKPDDKGEGFCALRHLAALRGEKNAQKVEFNITDINCVSYSASTCLDL